MVREQRYFSLSSYIEIWLRNKAEELSLNAISIRNGTFLFSFDYIHKKYQWKKGVNNGELNKLVLKLSKAPAKNIKWISNSSQNKISHIYARELKSNFIYDFYIFIQLLLLLLYIPGNEQNSDQVHDIVHH